MSVNNQITLVRFDKTYQKQEEKRPFPLDKNGIVSYDEAKHYLTNKQFNSLHFQINDGFIYPLYVDFDTLPLDYKQNELINAIISVYPFIKGDDISICQRVKPKDNKYHSIHLHIKSYYADTATQKKIWIDFQKKTGYAIDETVYCRKVFRLPFQQKPYKYPAELKANTTPFIPDSEMIIVKGELIDFLFVGQDGCEPFPNEYVPLSDVNEIVKTQKRVVLKAKTITKKIAEEIEPKDDDVISIADSELSSASTQPFEITEKYYRGMLDCLSQDTCDDQKKWRNIIYATKTSCPQFEDILYEWCLNWSKIKSGEKCESDMRSDFVYQFKRDYKQMTYKTIRYYAIDDNREKYEKLISSIKKERNGENDDMSVMSGDNEYFYWNNYRDAYEIANYLVRHLKKEGNFKIQKTSTKPICFYLNPKNNLWITQEIDHYILKKMRDGLKREYEMIKKLDDDEIRMMLGITGKKSEMVNVDAELMKNYNNRGICINQLNSQIIKLIVAEETQELIDNTFGDKLDTKAGCFAFSNGVYNVKEKEPDLAFTEGFKKDDYISKPNPFPYEKTYDQDAMNYVIQKITEIANNDGEHFNFIMRCIAVSLCADPERLKAQHFFSFYGAKGSNGKSALFNILNGIFPEYVCKINKEFITEKTTKAHKFLVKFKKNRMIFITEAPDENTKIDLSLVKEITGEAQIDNEVMYSTSESIRIIGKLIIFSNHLLQIVDSNNPTKIVDAGIKRRFLQQAFNARFLYNYQYEDEMNKIDGNEEQKEKGMAEKLLFKIDDAFETKLKSEQKYITALYHLIIKTSTELYKEGFRVPDYVLKQSEETIKNKNPIADFFEETFDVCQGEIVSKTQFTQLYNEYYKKNIKFDRTIWTKLVINLQSLHSEITYNSTKMGKAPYSKCQGVLQNIKVKEIKEITECDDEKEK